MTPKRFDELLVVGFLDALPADGLRRPVVLSALLFDPKTEAVLVPPFEIEGERLAHAADEIDRAMFESLCERGEATALDAGAARRDGCFLCAAGEGAPEYTSLSVAAAHLREFAAVRTTRGDAALRRGDHATAEREYADAAATVQTSESYARLLLVPTLSARRRARIESLRDAAARAAVDRSGPHLSRP